MERRKKSEFEEQVIQIDRITRVVAGGRRLRFRATVIVGNRAGKVGVGVAKANEVIVAVQKAISRAKKNLIDAPIINETIPHDIKISLGPSVIFLKPASQGTGIIAGGAIRTIADLAGIKNLIGKILGSPNKINNAKAMIMALKQLQRSVKKFPPKDIPASREIFKKEENFKETLANTRKESSEIKVKEKK